MLEMDVPECEDGGHKSLEKCNCQSNRWVKTVCVLFHDTTVCNGMLSIL